MYIIKYKINEIKASKHSSKIIDRYSIQIELEMVNEAELWIESEKESGTDSEVESEYELNAESVFELKPDSVSDRLSVAIINSAGISGEESRSEEECMEIAEWEEESEKADTDSDDESQCSS